jgi:hypothetical protein
LDNNVSEREMKRVILNLFIRWQSSRRANRGDPGQPNQHLSPPRGGSPAVSHAAVDESTRDKNERIIRLAARPMEDSSPRSNGELQEQLVHG